MLVVGVLVGCSQMTETLFILRPPSVMAYSRSVTKRMPVRTIADVWILR